MLRMQYWAAIRWFWSTSTLATFTLPWYCFATSSTTGATMRQGPHHSAQKSTRTGTFDWSTSESNVLSLTWMTESDIGQDSLHDEWTAPMMERFPASEAQTKGFRFPASRPDSQS